MRKTALACVTDLARQDDRVCFIGSDLGHGVMDDFSIEFPERIFREGITEQHIIGMAAGLALDGRIVYINTLAAFLTKRCLEQIALDLCLERAKVRLLGSGGGLVYAPLGPSHLATEDFALLGALPDMTIVAPCDAAEMRRLLPMTLDIDGPVYVRLAKGGDALVSPANCTLPFGAVVPLDADAARFDILFVTTGITAQPALAAASMLKENGLTAGVVHCPVVKPLDERGLLEYLMRAKCVIAVEEHVAAGGLGASTGLLILRSFQHAPRFAHISLPDCFFSEYGSQKEILEHYGISSKSLREQALSIMGGV